MTNSGPIGLFARWLAVLLVGIIVLWPHEQARAGADVSRIEPVTVVTAKGSFTFTSEIADTPPLRTRGLMFRQRLPKDRAMLFDYGDELVVTMWMKNTYISLDMIFIAWDGRVVRIARNTTPKSLKLISSGALVTGVLEVAAGTADRIGLKPGDRVLHPAFR